MLLLWPGLQNHAVLHRQQSSFSWHVSKCSVLRCQEVCELFVKWDALGDVQAAGAWRENQGWTSVPEGVVSGIKELALGSSYKEGIVCRLCVTTSASEQAWIKQATLTAHPWTASLLSEMLTCEAPGRRVLLCLFSRSVIYCGPFQLFRRNQPVRFLWKRFQALCELSQAASMEVLTVQEWTMTVFDCTQLRAWQISKSSGSCVITAGCGSPS